jgi:hypothetical protein
MFPDMKIDLHCHSKYSHDNYVEPEELIDLAIQKGLDGVCFTEHYSVEASRPVDRIRPPGGFLVFRGVEISTSSGHLLAYGLKDDSWNRWSRNHFLEIEEVVRIIHEMGGVCAPAHPFRGIESLGDRLFDLPGLDAVETHNGNNTREMNERAQIAAKKLGLSSIGGSDCHFAPHVGNAYTEFSNRIHSMEELVDQIRKGNCRGVLHNR